MKLKITLENTWRNIFQLTFLLVISCFFTCVMGCSKKTTESAGRILSIDLPKRSFQPGEILTVHVKVRNDGPQKDRFVVALNILYGDETVYDSHHGKKSYKHEGDECLNAWVDTGTEQTIGTFVYKIPASTKPGTYHVLVGLRRYPWEPLLMFRGARWCPPETTFEIRK